jgi:hypothetical protein
MRIGPLRQRTIGAMTARHSGKKMQKDYIRCVENLAAFIRRHLNPIAGSGIWVIERTFS